MQRSVALLGVVLLVVVGAAFCADGQQRASDFVISNSSDSESPSEAGVPYFTQDDVPDTPPQQARVCIPWAGVSRVYCGGVSVLAPANQSRVDTGDGAMAWNCGRRPAARIVWNDYG